MSLCSGRKGTDANPFTYIFILQEREHQLYFVPEPNCVEELYAQCFIISFFSWPFLWFYCFQMCPFQIFTNFPWSSQKPLMSCYIAAVSDYYLFSTKFSAVLVAFLKRIWSKAAQDVFYFQWTQGWLKLSTSCRIRFMKISKMDHC